MDDRHSRRRILQAGAGLLAPAALAGSALAGSALAQGVPALPDAAAGRPAPHREKGEPPMPMTERVGFAVVGLGKLSLDEILPAFGECRSAKLTALVSGNADKAKAVAARYGVPSDAVYDYAGYDRIKDDPRIGAVYIVLPNSLHAEYTERAFRAGKHVLCEKPMEVSVEACERMIRAGEAAGRKLMIAYRSQFEPHNVEAMRRIRAGELGDLRVVVTDAGHPTNLSDPADQWRLKKSLAGGGSLPDIGIYGLNAQRYLTGEEPVEITARIHNPPNDPRFAEVEDVVVWQARFPSGVLANGSTSYTYTTTNRFEVIGTKKRLVMDPATPYQGNRLALHSEAGEEQPKIKAANQFARELDHMARAILDDTAVTTPGEEGMQDVRLILAIYESARTGKPVQIDWHYARKVDPAKGAA